MRFPTFGYKRLTAVINRRRKAMGLKNVKAKRVYRIAKESRLLFSKKAGISHKMGRRFLRRGTCTFSSSGTAIYGVSLIHNQLGLDALVDCFKN